MVDDPAPPLLRLVIATRDRGLPKADIVLELSLAGEITRTFGPAGMLVRESDDPIRLDYTDRRSIALALRVAAVLFLQAREGIGAQPSAPSMVTVGGPPAGRDRAAGRRRNDP